MTSVRRMTLGDLVVLIIALAVGFSWARHDRYFQSDPQERWNFTEVGASQWLELGCCLGVTLAVAVLWCRMRHPRPRWGRLRRQAGWMSCVAVLAGVVYSGLGNVEYLTGGTDIGERVETFLAMLVIPTEAGGVAVGMWLAAWLSGVLRAERSWVDRLGRVIGVFWAFSGCAYTYVLAGW
jgi:hypothetical protein